MHPRVSRRHLIFPLYHYKIIFISSLFTSNYKVLTFYSYIWVVGSPSHTNAFSETQRYVIFQPQQLFSSVLFT